MRCMSCGVNFIYCFTAYTNNIFTTRETSARTRIEVQSNGKRLSPVCVFPFTEVGLYDEKSS